MRLFSAYLDLVDLEICKYAQLARSYKIFFHIIDKLSIVLLARQVNLEAYLQLVIP